MDTSGTAKQKQETTNTSSLFTLLKRSNTMKQLTVLLLTLVMSISLTFGQNIKLKGSGGTIAGIVNVKGNIDNTGSSGTYAFSGTVTLNGITGTQDIGGSGVLNPLTFTTLTAAGSVAKNQNVRVTVSGVLTNSSGTTYTLGGHSLSLGDSPIFSSGSLVATNAVDTVYYTRIGSGQTILATTYRGVLALSGSGAKSLAAATTAGQINHTASSGALTVGFPLTIDSVNNSSLDGVVVSSTLSHTGTGTLTIANVTDLTSGTITNLFTGTTAFTQANFSTSTGTVNAINGALTFAGNVAVSASGNLSLSNASTATFTNNLTNAGTVSFGGTSTVTYNNNTASNNQSVLGTSYVNLTITGASDSVFANSGHKLVSANLAVSGALTIAANNVLDMGSASNTLSVGPGTNNSGRISWAGGNTFVTGTGVTEFYSGTAATIAANVGYGTIWLTGSGAKTISGTVISGPGSGLGIGVLVNNNLTVDGTGLLTVNGDLEVSSTGSIANTGSITVQ